VAESNRIDELRRRVQKDPASLAFAQLAEELRRAGELQDAIRVCKTGLAQHPEYLSARVTLGRALLADDQLDAAFTELSTALAAAPENLAALRGLAEIQQRRGDARESLILYRRALTLAPQDPELAAAVAALEPPEQTWSSGPAPAAPAPSEAPPPTPAPASAGNWQNTAAPGESPAAASADPAPDLASQQASLAAFFGEPQPEPDAGPDWLAALDGAAAQVLATDSGTAAISTDLEVQPESPAREQAAPDSLAESGPAPVEWIPDISAIAEAAPKPAPDPDPEAARAEVLQRWLDAILASRSGQPSADDRA
jgi:hypothetical protein